MARRDTGKYRLLNRIGLIGTLAPIAAWLLALALVRFLASLGCQIDEGSSHPCVFLGRDLTDLAYSLGFFAAWGPLILFPICAGVAMLWGLTRLILFIAQPKD
ncbi:hypothetical protein [Pseudooceanicola spongiae]|uniref:hypothetical protein n=1 Tax=Pseudooceanicola spongiae TaxID=2613965 RepID=UPI001D02FED0|nr:hypothetical protein [Pseudooceanicola spongiae]